MTNIDNLADLHLSLTQTFCQIVLTELRTELRKTKVKRKQQFKQWMRYPTKQNQFGDKKKEFFDIENPES